MEYKVNIQGLPGVDLYADKLSADKLVASVAPATEAAPFIRGQKATFTNKLVKVRKTIAKKPVKKMTAPKAAKAKAKRKK
jgi:hypothetical protein